MNRHHSHDYYNMLLEQLRQSDKILSYLSPFKETKFL